MWAYDKIVPVTTAPDVAEVALEATYPTLVPEPARLFAAEPVAEAVLPITDVPFAGADALAATDVSRPKLTAVTATSAIRLRSVFVDICFLSISQLKNFLNWLGNLSIS
jgi:hypothetical protein